MTGEHWLLIGMILGVISTLLGVWYGAKLMYHKQGGTGKLFEDDGYKYVEDSAGEDIDKAE